MANDVRNFRRAGWQLDVGAGNRIEMEFDSSGQLWLAMGKCAAELSAWFKGVAGFDVRVGVEQRSDGLLIRLDRGDIQPWWSDEHSPQIILRIDGAGNVRITANGPEIQQEVLLGQARV